MTKSKIISGIPKGIRTPVTAVKGRCPRPLDDRDTKTDNLPISNSAYYLISISKLILLITITVTNKISGIPKGIRTPVTAVKGRCPRPLDDRDTLIPNEILNYKFIVKSSSLVNL